MLFCLLLIVSKMCMHPVLDRKLSDLYSKYKNVNLDEFDNCDYVHRITDVGPTDLVVLQLNIRGVGSKRTDLIDLIDTSVQGRQPDVLLLSETWLTPFSPKICIPGYELFHQDRTDKRGGGVAILISKKLRCSVRNDLSSKLKESECITVDIVLKNGTHCLVSSMYRPPNSDIPTFLASYNSLICAMKKERPKGIIVGLDHNLDFLKSSKHCTTNDFIQNNLDFGLIPTITRPTRITKNSATLIDNIIVSQNFCGAYVSSVLVRDTSDHLPTTCVLESMITTKKEPLIIKCRDTRLKNVAALKSHLSQHDWQTELSDPSPSKNMEKIHETITTVIDNYLPYREHTIKQGQIRREPWLSASIKISIDLNKRYYRKMLRQECSIEKYKSYNSLLRKTIRAAKVKFYNDMCCEYKSQTKKLWGLINEIAGKKNDKSGVIEYLNVDGIREYKAQTISNRFAKYFSEVGKQFSNRIPSSTKPIKDYLHLIQSNQASLFLHPTNTQEIKKIVSKLPNKRSSGHDNISNILLKDIIDYIALALTEVCNKSMMIGEFPTVMKLAEVVPLYKCKEHFLESNYRPISLLTTISKVLEKIVYQRVYNFLQDTHQICENQFGFRANHSCEHAIGQVVSSLVKNNENRKYRCCVLLDLSKAFDTIEHTILLNKLELYGIRGNALSWFKSYLTDRKLRVKCKTFSNMKEVRSKDFPIEYGTPQGSCLGPLIFLIFVNDLQLHLQFSESVQFADDTTLLLSHRNPTYLQFCVESELANIQDYFNANKLTLNVSKSMYILYHNQKTPPLDFRVKLNGIDLPRTNCAKLLGVWLDDKLKWDTHVNKLIHKLKSGLGMMRRSKNFLTPKAKRLLYFGQIHSNLSYALSIWGTMLQRSLIKKLNRLQKEAIRLINPKTLEIELYKNKKYRASKP